MKKRILILLAVFPLVCCGGRGNVGEKAGETSDNQNETVMKPIELTKADFLTRVADFTADEWKYLGDKPAIIDFYATWCGPCRAIAPILDELAAKHAGELYIFKVDTDREQELAAAFGIRSIPTLLFVPMNGQPKMAQGALSKSTFEEMITTFLLKKE